MWHARHANANAQDKDIHTEVRGHTKANENAQVASQLTKTNKQNKKQVPYPAEITRSGTCTCTAHRRTHVATHMPKNAAQQALCHTHTRRDTSTHDSTAAT
jgi:hypothetical protein